MNKLSLAALALAATVASTAAGAPPLSVSDEWVRAPAPGVPMTAAYFTLHNATRGDAALVGVESSRFERVEMHRSTVVDGVARMERVERIDIPARGRVSLAPGGLHLMLFRPVGPVRDGDQVDFTLTFDDGWTLELDVPVRRSH